MEDLEKRIERLERLLRLIITKNKDILATKTSLSTDDQVTWKNLSELCDTAQNDLFSYLDGKGGDEPR